MKKNGILNPALAAGLARLGHLDTVLIADCGTPIPRGVPLVDLSLVFGVPRFTEVLDALLGELVIESAVAANECRGSVVEEWLTERLTVDLAFISHEGLKARLPDASLVVRTGEATPYANVLLISSVPF